VTRHVIVALGLLMAFQALDHSLHVFSRTGVVTDQDRLLEGVGTRAASKHTLTEYVAGTWTPEVVDRPAQWLNTAWILVSEPPSRTE
jgi:hypothetical protein